MAMPHGEYPALLRMEHNPSEPDWVCEAFEAADRWKAAAAQVVHRHTLPRADAAAGEFQILRDVGAEVSASKNNVEKFVLEFLQGRMPGAGGLPRVDLIERALGSLPYILVHEDVLRGLAFDAGKGCARAGNKMEFYEKSKAGRSPDKTLETTRRVLEDVAEGAGLAVSYDALGRPYVYVPAPAGNVEAPDPRGEALMRSIRQASRR